METVDGDQLAALLYTLIKNILFIIMNINFYSCKDCK